jgi:glycosyltransferase involved in cell wall biosynthesis
MSLSAQVGLQVVSLSDGDVMKKACMIVYSFYPDDPRVRREAEALMDAGWKVDIICLRGDEESAVQSYQHAQVYRLSCVKRRGASLSTYLAQYSKFFLLATARLVRLHMRRRYDLVQVHNMPDFLVFTALVPKMLGTHVILDIHDLVPELYAAKFVDREDHPFVRLMRWTERRSTRFAHHVITVGETFRRRLEGRSVPSERLTVVMNSADTRLFHPMKPRVPSNGDFRLVYHGGVFERYGLDVAVRAVARLKGQIPGLQFEIYGGGDALESVTQLVADLGVQDIVHLSGAIPLEKVPDRIAGADMGVIPYRSNLFTELLYPTKAFEYIAMGIPFVMSRTSAMRELFGDIPDLFVAPDDVEGLAAHILALYHSPARRQRLLLAESEAYKPFAWDEQRRKYVTLVDRITGVQPVRMSVSEGRS